MKFLARAAQRFSLSLFKTAIGIISLSLFILSGSQQLFSQGNAGRILGSVTDQTGGAVVGATVTILDTSRNVTRTLTTDSAGEYNAPNLLPGTYTVSAAVQGFKTAVRSGLTLEVYQDMRVDLTLQPGEQSEKVTVTGETPLVETTNAELGGTIQNVIINDLPLNGRNFENLLSLRPGVTIYPGGGGWTQSTNGIRAHDNVYLVDGINSDDPWMAQSIMNAGMAAGDAGTILPIDAIDEFKTEENPSAEYGWKPGSRRQYRNQVRNQQHPRNRIRLRPRRYLGCPGLLHHCSGRRRPLSLAWNSLAPPSAAPSRRTSSFTS